MEEYMLPCVHKKIFGIECFGCGTQRAIMLILQGDFGAAFKMYPAIYTTILFFIIVFLHFVDKKRNYNKMLIFLAIFNATIMIISYFYKYSFLLTN
ncbi:DUF2752 domain-containing protein [Flavobacterium sp. I3-2]|uniref:DUF2752 domain-containing protein n=1 Tax=Flavobacterium sp. I3-2 TaxID=2748319 RepID=UPI0015ABD7DC|nr:DUF2752 domain-containing protein [Flavobacterium sp. I3-2]